MYISGTENNDFLVANSALDSTLDGLGGNDTLLGGAGNDTLNGGDGNDILNGGADADFLFGGVGDDTYVIDSFDDLVVEEAGAGVDTVRASINYTLGDNVEKLILSSSATAARGNSSNNYLVANAALGSTLNGLGGNDTLLGGTGNDTLNGGDGNDSLTGGAGNDRLVGFSGNDTLIGGAGSDRFEFFSSSFAMIGVDVITDFTSGQDKMVLYTNNFSGLIAANFSFAIATSNDDAASNSARIVYNSTNGSLFYNQNGDGSGFGSGGQFATLAPNLTLTANDFIIASSFSSSS